MEKFLSARTQLMKASQVRALLKWIGRDVISLGGGIPDPASFPVNEIQDILREVLSMKAAVALQYAPTEGIDELRKELADFMRKRGLKASSENLLITSGSQEALDLLGRVLIDRGDWILTENPTYLGALQAFVVYEPRIEGASMDENGVNVEAVERVLKEAKRRGTRVKFIYTIPTCHNPTGSTQSFERRKLLLELAEEYDTLVVEDDPYSYFTFEGGEPPSLKSMDDGGKVIYVSTVSKLLAPGLRLGWVIADEALINALAVAKQAVTLQSPTLCQYVLLEALRKSLIEKQLPRIKEIYRRRRDVMLEALSEHMPESAQWTRPRGGMFVWLTAPSRVNLDALLPLALEKYKVAYVPGTSFHIDGSGYNTARLSFSYPPLDSMKEGVARLARMIKEHM
ncbi:MAG: PLP-dependent aminotransferase family protein [Thermofilaceae archaeon]